MPIRLACALIVLVGCGSPTSTQEPISSDPENQDTVAFAVIEETNSNEVEGLFYLDFREQESLIPARFSDSLITFESGVRIRLKATEPIGSFQAILPRFVLDSIGLDHRNMHLNALDIESFQLSQHQGQVRKRRDTLDILLPNGIWKSYPPDQMMEEADMNLERYDDQWGFYIIRIQWHEGNGYAIVNHRTGVITRMNGKPFFSPDGKHILSVMEDVEATYSTNGLEMYDVVDGVVTQSGHLYPETWGPNLAKWTSDSTAVLRCGTYDFESDSFDYGVFYMRLSLLSDE